MRKLSALITATFTDSGIRRLQDLMDVEYRNWFEQRRPYTEGELESLCRGKDVFIFEEEEVSRRLLDAVGTLKIIACCRGLRGDDPSIDLHTCRERAIPVLVAPGRNANSVAEFTILLTMAALRKLRTALNWLYGGQWKEPKDFYRTFRTGEIHGKTVGLIGFGNIGRRASALFRAFGARVLACDPYVDDPAVFQQHGAVKVDMETLLRESDIVSLHMSVTDETKGLIGQREIALMKPTAILVNTARAVLVDHDALYEALVGGRIAGAALDVYHKEPASPENEPLLGLENVFATPHLAGTSVEVAKNHSEMIVSDLLRLLRGEMPRNIFNPEVLPAFWEKMGLTPDVGRKEV